MLVLPSCQSLCPTTSLCVNTFRIVVVRLITSRLIVNWVYNYNIILMLLRVKVYIFLSLFVLLECGLMLMTSTTEFFFLNVKLLKQGYRYHKTRTAFSKFYHRHS